MLVGLEPKLWRSILEAVLHIQTPSIFLHNEILLHVPIFSLPLIWESCALPLLSNAILKIHWTKTMNYSSLDSPDRVHFCVTFHFCERIFSLRKTQDRKQLPCPETSPVSIPETFSAVEASWDHWGGDNWILQVLLKWKSLYKSGWWSWFGNRPVSHASSVLSKLIPSGMFELIGSLKETLDTTVWICMCVYKLVFI